MPFKRHLQRECVRLSPHSEPDTAVSLKTIMTTPPTTKEAHDAAMKKRRQTRNRLDDLQEEKRLAAHCNDLF